MPISRLQSTGNKKNTFLDSPPLVRFDRALQPNALNSTPVQRADAKAQRWRQSSREGTSDRGNATSAPLEATEGLRDLRGFRV